MRWIRDEENNRKGMQGLKIWYTIFIHGSDRVGCNVHCCEVNSKAEFSNPTRRQCEVTATVEPSTGAPKRTDQSFVVEVTVRGVGSELGSRIHWRNNTTTRRSRYDDVRICLDSAPIHCSTKCIRANDVCAFFFHRMRCTGLAVGLRS